MNRLRPSFFRVPIRLFNWKALGRMSCLGRAADLSLGTKEPHIRVLGGTDF